jgi:hypothetical protein
MDFPPEYRYRMLAEQMAIMEALQFIAQILICFFLLIAFLILIVNLSDTSLKLLRRHSLTIICVGRYLATRLSRGALRR